MSNPCLSTAYAVWFDYKRRSEPDFRRGLRRNERRQVRVEKEEAKASSQQQRQRVKNAVAAAVDEGFPTDPSEREMYFMEQVSKGEVLGSDREFPRVDVDLRMGGSLSPLSIAR